MKKHLLLFSLLLGCSFLIGQSPKIDSLEAIFKLKISGEEKLEILQQMVDLAFNTDIKLALKYARRGVILADQTDDKNWQPRFYEMEGRMHANLLQLDSATLFFDKAMAGYTAIDDQKGQATTAFKIAWVHRKKEEIDKAMEADRKALRLMEALEDKRALPMHWGGSQVI